MTVETGETSTYTAHLLQDGILHQREVQVITENIAKEDGNEVTAVVDITRGPQESQVLVRKLMDSILNQQKQPLS